MRTVRGRRVRIAFFNPFFDEWPSVGRHECATPAEFGHGPASVAMADALVFHLPTLHVEQLDAVERRSGQLWVGWSLESPASCPLLHEPSTRRRFDLLMTYERSSDVWHPYLDRASFESYVRVPRHDAPDPVVWVQSNPDDSSGRLTYASELMKRVRVASYGELGTTHPGPLPGGAAARRALYGRHKFTLAFENAIASDYVTEKFYEPLVAGSVPVYRGAPEIAEFAPSGSFVDASRFESAVALAEHLDRLDRDDGAYAAFHEWRARPLEPHVVALLERVRERPLCRLAAAVAAIAR